MVTVYPGFVPVEQECVVSTTGDLFGQFKGLVRGRPGKHQGGRQETRADPSQH